MGVHFGPRDELVPWKGMRRTATPYGMKVDWYETSADKPNTIVEVCIMTDLAGCPNR